MADSDFRPTVAFHPMTGRTVSFGPFRFDRIDGVLERDGEEVRLPPRALAVLHYLIERPGRLVTKAALMEGVWKESHVSETSLTEAVGVLRDALGDDRQQPTYIQTVHRRGYRFIAVLGVASAPSALGAVPQAAPPGAAPGEAVNADALPGIIAARDSRSSSRGARTYMAVAVALAVGAAIGAAAAQRLRARVAAAPVTRVTITLPAEDAPAPALTAHPVMSFSPDSRELVYVAGSSRRYRLLRRHLDRFEAEPIDGTAGGHGPVFSPDGGRIAFVAEGHLMTVARSGTPADHGSADGAFGVTWIDRSTVLVPGSAMWWRVSVTERRRDPIAVPGTSGDSWRWPQMLPDGDSVLVTRWRGTPASATVARVSLGSGQVTELVTAAVFGRLFADHLLFVRDSTIFAVPYRPGERLSLEAAVVVQADVMVGRTGAAQFDVSPSGALIHVPADHGRTLRRIRRVTTAGAKLPSAVPNRAFQNVAVCGTRLAVTIAGGEGADIWIGDVMRGPLARLTLDGGNLDPTWSPGCESVAFMKNRADGHAIYRQLVHGQTEPERLTGGARLQSPGAWSRHGNALLVTEAGSTTGFDLARVPLGGPASTSLLRTPATELGPRLSHDGRWLAFESNATGQFLVHVTRADRPDAGVPVSEDRSWSPTWAGDAPVLYFLATDAVYRVGVADREGAPVPDEPVKLFRDPDAVQVRALPGNELLLLSRIREHEPLTTLRLVVNWADELARLTKQ